GTERAARLISRVLLSAHEKIGAYAKLLNRLLAGYEPLLFISPARARPRMPFLPRMLSRRRFLAGAGVAFGSLGLPAISSAEVASDGFRILRAGQGATRGTRQPPSWGYDGTAPGPTLRLERGEEL